MRVIAIFGTRPEGIDLQTIVLTTHRRENFDELQNIYEAVNRLVQTGA